MHRLLTKRPQGLYCPAGDFFIDPWRPVPTAVITHGHGDHARPGSSRYFCAESSVGILRHRLGAAVSLRGVPYRDRFRVGDANVTFYPAGHILGSAQVLIESEGRRLVISGDYKREADPTCEPFEVVECDTFVTEATFALPIYRWESGEETAREILGWWKQNTHAGRASILYAYSLGKAQRILAELAKLTDQSVFIHESIAALTDIYRLAGIKMLPTISLSDKITDKNFAGELILVPPAVNGTAGLSRFGNAEEAFASGWMRVRAHRRRHGYARGFVLSDHADWAGLIRTIEQTRAKQILVTHGRSDLLVRYLRERNISAESLDTFLARSPA